MPDPSNGSNWRTLRIRSHGFERTFRVVKEDAEPLFGGEEKRLYRETKLQYMVSKHKKEKNHHVYAKDETLSYFSLAINPEFENEEKILTDKNHEEIVPQVFEEEVSQKWKLL